MKKKLSPALHEPLRVLEVLRTVPENPGGIEAFVLRAAEHMDREGLQIDFLSAYPCASRDWMTRAEAAGGTIHTLGLARGAGKAAMLSAMVRFLKEHPYDVVHVHSGWIMELAAWTAAAKLAGTGRIILHSHGAGADENPVARLLKTVVCRLPVLRLSDERCACSRVSAKWIYGKRAAKRVRVIRDGIPADRFRYDPRVREELRRRYSIPETCFVAGYVANFYPVKNHPFLLEVFSEILEREPDARLLLVGDGEEKDRIREYAKRMKLSDRVIFTGTTDRVPDCLQMMDVFVFPSWNEGFGIASVEAQAAGLPVVASDSVPKETKVTDDVVFLPLADGAAAWAETVLGFRGRIRIDGTDRVRTGGYDIRGIAEEIRKLYFAGSEERK